MLSPSQRAHTTSAFVIYHIIIELVNDAQNLLEESKANKYTLGMAGDICQISIFLKVFCRAAQTC